MVASHHHSLVGGFAFTFPLALLIEFLGVLAGLYPWDINAIYLLASLVLYAVVTWCWIALSIKHLHDRERSAWWMLLLVATIISLVIWLVMVGCQSGDEWTNRYGPPTKVETPRIIHRNQPILSLVSLMRWLRCRGC